MTPKPGAALTWLPNSLVWGGGLPAAIDQAEDREHGIARGDELPRAPAGRAERLARLQQAKAQLEAEAAARQQRYQQRVAELAATTRARGQRPRAHIRPRRRDEAPNPKVTINTTDPDSRFVRGNGRSRTHPAAQRPPAAGPGIQSDSLRAAMLARLGSEQGKICYVQRSRTIEPVFGQVKTVQGGGRFMRRGLLACAAEWKLLCGTHNLLKLWRRGRSTTS